MRYRQRRTPPEARGPVRGPPKALARGGDPMATGWFAWTCLLLAAGSPGGSDDVVHMNQRGFQIPIKIQPERQADVRELILYVSRDQGRTWGISARATPDKKGFDVFEPQDGLLFFS